MAQNERLEDIKEWRSIVDTRGSVGEGGKWERVIGKESRRNKKKIFKGHKNGK